MRMTTEQSNASEPYFCRRLPPVVSLAAITILAACASATQRNTPLAQLLAVASAETPPETIVITGTVTEIFQVRAKRPSQRNWGVTVRVEKVNEGKYSQPEFTFTVHSPARSNLEIGGRYTIEAKWTGQEYIVNDLRWYRRES
jgi:hypothetical protein